MSDAPGPVVRFGEVWTVEEWNAYFAHESTKVDADGGFATNLTINGGTLTNVAISGSTDFTGPQGPPGPPGPGISPTDPKITGAYIGCVIAGKPATGQVFYIAVPFGCSINTLLAGTVVYAGTAATSNAVFTVNRITSGNVSTALGTITVTNASNFSATLAGAGGVLLVGDVVQIVCPSPQDATLADLGITIAGVRT